MLAESVLLSPFFQFIRSHDYINQWLNYVRRKVKGKWIILLRQKFGWLLPPPRNHTFRNQLSSMSCKISLQFPKSNKILLFSYACCPFPQDIIMPLSERFTDLHRSRKFVFFINQSLKWLALFVPNNWFSLVGFLRIVRRDYMKKLLLYYFSVAFLVLSVGQANADVITQSGTWSNTQAQSESLHSTPPWVHNNQFSKDIQGKWGKNGIWDIHHVDYRSLYFGVVLG